MKLMPPLEEIQKQLEYCPQTGDLTWLVTRHRITSGDVAGYVNSIGYRVVRLFGSPYLAHRLAWYLHYGEQPGEIDHINRDRSDNRIENLRVVSRSENNFNQGNRNKYGVKGLYKTARGKFALQYGNRHLGTFDTVEDAAKERSKHD